MNELCRKTAGELARLIRQRAVSCQEVVEAHLAQITEVNPALNAVVELTAETARAEAAEADGTLMESEPLGPLHGVPFTVKDSLETVGALCTAGTLGCRERRTTQDATVVGRLRAAGAILLGKTNLPDLLFAFESDNLIYGRTNNPYDYARTSGGSSGGEAAIIGAFGSPLGLGSDAAGSIRLPAHFCGITGIKPTSGRLPRTGHFPPAGGWIESLWQIGPMARSVADLQLVMPLLIGHDWQDRTVMPMPWTEEVDLRSLRVAFYTDNGITAVTPETKETVIRAARTLSSEVKLVEEDRPAVMDQSLELEQALLGVDGGAGLMEYHRQLGGEKMHPLLAGWLELLRPYATDLAGFAKLWMRLDSFRAKMHRFLQRYDVILCPVYTQPALPHGESLKPCNFEGFSYTMTYNLTGWPAAVVRYGTSPEGLPIGVQIVAHPWRENVALGVARRLEETLSLPDE